MLTFLNPRAKTALRRSLSRHRSLAASTRLTNSRALSSEPGRLQQLWRRHSRVQLDRRQLTVITGCDSGLGYSAAVRASEHGCSVLAGVLDAASPGARALAARPAVRVRPLDLAEPRSRREFARSVSQALQDEGLKLHALVNNSGIMIFGLFDWLLPEQVERQQQVNLVGPQLLTRELAAHLRQHRGRLINVSSHCAESALPGLSVYAATKAALEAWTGALRIEFKNYGARAIVFVPGSFVMSSNIMTRQKEYFDQIHAAMSEETRSFYKGYFDEYRRYLEPMAFQKRHDLLQDEDILRTFDGALLDKWPSAKYKCEPLRYKIYHSLFGIVPVTVRDWLVEKFMQMPKFKQF